MQEKFCGEAILNPTYVTNRVPTKALEKMVPYDSFWERKLSVSCFKIFGCDAYAKVPKTTRKKFNACRRKVNFLVMIFVVNPIDFGILIKIDW